METMVERLKEIYKSVKKDCPTLNAMSVHIGETQLGVDPSIWIHHHEKPGVVCEHFKSTADYLAGLEHIKNRRARKELLFRQF